MIGPVHPPMTPDSSAPMPPAPAPGGERVCVFTIASRNYTPAVRALFDGVARHAPAAHRVLALCDTPGEIDYSGDGFEVLSLDALDLPARQSFLFQYSLIELNTAIKPFVIAALFARGFDRVIYFDPDIAVLAPLDDMIARLDTADLLVTPHLTAPLEDGGYPDERTILMCGTFNLGFIAVSNTPAARAFVAWWQRRLTREGAVDLARGMFTDQKWVDFAPSFVERVEVVRHPGWNVAYWNLAQRDVRRADGGWVANGAPLVFFHFSGFDASAGLFSRHQNRFELEALPADVRALVRDYETLLRRHGYPALTAATFGLATFGDGTPIPDLVRRLYREHRDVLDGRITDPAGADLAAFIAWANEPAEESGRRSPWITRVFREVHRSYPDVQLDVQFPDLFGVHAELFARWCVGDGVALHGLPDVFLAPMRTAIAGSAPAVPTAWSVNRWAFHAAWRFKHLVRPFAPVALRVRLGRALFHRAYGPAVAAAGRASTAAAPTSVTGVNVLGYLRGELGVGEAARATLRACAAAGISVAAIEYTHNPPSRMDEDLPAATSTTPDHGITIVHLNADQSAYAMVDHDTALRDRYRIGYWNWELPEFPDTWPDAERLLDEVWAPSTFCATAFSRRLRLPVTHVPYAVQVPVVHGPGRDAFGLPSEAYIFFFMFDAHSVPERKNPMAVVEAFQRAAPQSRRPVHLVVKMINASESSPPVAALRRAAAADPAITLIDRYLARPELTALMQATDAYVSLHRSEGFGFTMAEAMSLGKPVVATGWSANMDFMTPWNSSPVAFRLVQLETDHGPYRRGQWWADPDVHDASGHMVRLVNEDGLGAAIGARAAAHMRQHYSPAAVGRIIAERLRVIAAQR